MTHSKYTQVSLEVIDGVGKLTIELPQFGNALDLKGLQEMLGALYEAEAREDVGAVMVTGRGKAFCSGFNLKEIPSLDDGVDEISAHFRVLAMWWHQVLHMFVRMPKPILAAVNGVAAGSGLGMTLCADMAVCAKSARFVCAWHTIGIANDATTSYSLAKIVGFRRAMELMFTNKTLDSADAVEWGLVNRCYEDGDFEKSAMDIAQQLAAGPTHLQAMAKESFHMGWRRSVEEATEYEIQNVMKSVCHPHFADCLKDFLSGEKKSSVEQVQMP